MDKERPAAGSPRSPGRRLVAAIAALLVVAVVVAAAVLVQQNVTTNPAAVAPDVVFAAGSGYATAHGLGFATLTVGSSATSATLAVGGVPGAASVLLTSLLNVVNQDATQDYNVTLSRSAAPDAAITGFTVTVKTTGGATVATWNAAATATSATFALAAGTTYVLDIATTIADGTAAGALGSFTMQVQLAPT